MPKALFIVGYWNSGTTLLVDLLRQHPTLRLRHARYKPNLEDRSIVKMLRRMGQDFIRFEANYRRVNEEGFAHYQEAAFDAAQRETFRRRFWRWYRVRPSQWLLLKNPWLWFMPNFLRSSFAEDQMRYLIIIRNGAMQTVSKDYWQRHTDDPEAKLRARARFWVRAMEYFYAHWHGRDDVYVMRYEALCEDTEGEIRRLCTWLGLPFAPLQAHLPEGLSNRTGKFDRLDPKLKGEVEQIIGPMQARLDGDYPG
jgi:hypothetical protein